MTISLPFSLYLALPATIDGVNTLAIATYSLVFFGAIVWAFSSLEFIWTAYRRNQHRDEDEAHDRYLGTRFTSLGVALICLALGLHLATVA